MRRDLGPLGGADEAAEILLALAHDALWHPGVITDETAQGHAVTIAILGHFRGKEHKDRRLRRAPELLAYSAGAYA